MAGPTSATPFFRRVLREPTFLVQKMLHVLSGGVIQPTEDEREKLDDTAMSATRPSTVSRYAGALASARFSPEPAVLIAAAARALRVERIPPAP